MRWSYDRDESHSSMSGMDGAKVDWYGAQLLQEIRTNTPDSLAEAAHILLVAAQAHAPRKTGFLAKSGYIATEKKSSYRANKRHNKQLKPPKGGALVAFAAFYARFREYGTGNEEAKPFLRPALDETKVKMGDRFVVSLGKKLK